jgi:hypothetical protein
MASLALYQDVSKTELAERYERMKSASRALAKKSEMYVAKTAGVVAASAGGATAAALHHVAVKALSPKLAEKAPWVGGALLDIGAIVFDGDSMTGHVVEAFAHGYSGYLAGKATEKILP